MILRLMLLTLGSGAVLIAQTITGAITGLVTDPSGAIIPNVKVTATNVATNVATDTQSNSAGIYNLVFLPIGSYNISAEAAGFKKVIVGPFVLEVGQTARIDVKLEVGEVTQSVEISDVAPILQTETTQTGDLVSGTQLEKLPMNGRNFISATLMVPGAITPNPATIGTATRFGAGGRPYVNGNREQSSNFLVEGIDTSETVSNRVGYSPNLDAVAEIKVITGNAPAEFGNANGAIVNMTLKSGTNQFHGNVFEFLRNDKLDANEWFDNRSRTPKRPLRQNIYGVTFGGPIVKNRFFFFLNYQGTRRRTFGPANASVVPQEMREGNLSRLTVPIKDPTVSSPCTTANRAGCFTGNLIPRSRIVNPAALALFSDPNLYPLPNNPGTGLIGVTSNYLGTNATVLNNDQADAKIDYRASDRDSVSGRFTIGRYFDGTGKTVIPTIMGSGTDGPLTGGVVTWTRTFSAAIVNEARLGFNRVRVTNNTLDVAGVLGPNGNQKLGIAGGQPIPGASAITLGEGFTNVGAGAADADTVSNIFQYGDNLTIQRGRHLMKMGGQLLRYQQNAFYAGNNGLLGSFTYSTVFTNSVFSDFLLNQLRSKGRGSQTGKWGHRQNRIGVFYQDDFKATSSLTLNLGLRWEYTQPLYEVANRQTNIDLINAVQLFAGQNGASRALYEPYHKQFMPRVGIAWVPGMFKQRLVVRAGYSITSFLEGTGSNLRLPLNPPFFFESDVQFVDAPGDIRTGFADVQPRAGLAGGQLRAWDPNLRPAFIQGYNLTLEYKLSNTLSLTTAYVGQKGTHLIEPREMNQPLPDPGPVANWRPFDQRRPLYARLPLVTNISGTFSSSTMNYNALQVSTRKRASHGFEFLTSYTLSKTLTDNRGFFGAGGGVNSEGAYWQNAYNRKIDRGPSFFDALHNFNFGGSYDLPIGRDRTFGRTMNRAADLVVGGWHTLYLVNAHSGFPVTITGPDNSRQSARDSAGGPVRPNRYKNLSYQSQTVDSWFGTGNTVCLAAGANDGQCAYGAADVGFFGNTGIGTERAPRFAGFNFAVGKQFRVDEKRYFDFRTELFNAFNHPSFGPPARSISSPSTFGSITTTVSSSRNIEFALKFYF